MDAIHFMRPGTHVSMAGASHSFTDADLDAIAAAYNPRLHEAPIVVGHPKTEAPAFGWVERIEKRPDGLYALPRNVNADFAELVRQGAYKKVSASFYPPDAANNPTPGQMHLRHLGFLGAQPPAVKGLQPINLAEAGGGAAPIDFEEAVIDLREARLASREREFRNREAKERLVSLAKEARILFADVEPLTEFLASLSEDRVISFADADGSQVAMPQAGWFLDFLARRPPLVVTGEIVKGEDFAEGDAAFEPPEGYRVDERGAELHRRAVAYQKQHGGSYTDAVTVVDATMDRR